MHYCTGKVKPKAKDKLASDSASLEGRKTISKRLLSNASYDALLDDDLSLQAKRDKKNLEKDNELGSRADPRNKSEIRLTNSMLSPKLRERFASLALS